MIEGRDVQGGGGPERLESALREALRLIGSSCPRLVSRCYWAGTSSIALEELHHRMSFDLDFHSRRALWDVRPVVTELQQAFGDDFQLTRAADAVGSGFQGTLRLPSGESVTIEVLSNHENVSPRELVPSVTEPSVLRVTLGRYLKDKVQCVLERSEARDFVDLRAALRARPELEAVVRRAVDGQDAILLAERLLGWTPEAMREDLAMYPDVDPADAVEMRDILLSWLRGGSSV